MHIDDLRDPEDMGSNLFSFCGTLISSLFCPAPPGMHSRIRRPLALFGFPDSLMSSNDLIRVEHNEGGETRRGGDFQVGADAILLQVMLITRVGFLI